MCEAVSGGAIVTPLSDDMMDNFDYYNSELKLTGEITAPTIGSLARLI